VCRPPNRTRYHSSLLRNSSTDGGQRWQRPVRQRRQDAGLAFPLQEHRGLSVCAGDHLVRSIDRRSGSRHLTWRNAGRNRRWPRATAIAGERLYDRALLETAGSGRQHFCYLLHRSRRSMPARPLDQLDGCPFLSGWRISVWHLASSSGCAVPLPFLLLLARCHASAVPVCGVLPEATCSPVRGVVYAGARRTGQSARLANNAALRIRKCS